MVKFGTTSLGSLTNAVQLINSNNLDCYEVAAERGSYPRSGCINTIPL